MTAVASADRSTTPWDEPDALVLVEEAEQRAAETPAPPRKPGSPMAALRHRDFRVLWAGSFLSNIGTWMQNVALGVFGYQLSQSATYVGLLVLAQLGPVLLLSQVGGVLAETVDRRRLLAVTQFVQLTCSLALAAEVSAAKPSPTLIALTVLVMGISQSLFGPTWGALLPTMVPREDLPGAVSLNSASMNGSRVLGSAIGGVLVPLIGLSGIMILNAATYLFVVASLLLVVIPQVPRRDDGVTGFKRVFSGLTVARNDQLVSRALITLAVFSLFCLTFIGQMPTVAARNLGLTKGSSTYGFLYATFGLGALLGALAVGTVFRGMRRPLLIRIMLVGFSAFLAVHAMVRSAALDFPVLFCLAFCYFATITVLSTELQSHLDDAVRGRIMALWMMCFGGVVPIGAMIAGPVIDASSPTVVLLLGAVIGLVLAVYANFDSVDRDGAAAAAEPLGAPS